MLKSWALPVPGDEADENERGTLLVIAGARELPGSAVLAATAALRAGAGRLRIATVRSIAVQVGIAVPEARVIGLTETDTGMISPAAVPVVAKLASDAEAVLFGPGLPDSEELEALVPWVTEDLGSRGLVVDANALVYLPEGWKAPGAVLTPNIGEMSDMLGVHVEDVEEDAVGHARQVAEDRNAVVALRGAHSWTAAPDGRVWCDTSATSGLATTGSGDVLVGIIAGLLARGAEPAQAAVWGVHLHGRAGEILSREVGPVGFLARELLPLIPRLLHELA